LGSIQDQGWQGGWLFSFFLFGPLHPRQSTHHHLGFIFCLRWHTAFIPSWKAYMYAPTDPKKLFHPRQSIMHAPPSILISQIYYVSDQHRFHSIPNRASCMHLIVNWDGLLHTQFGSTKNTHLLMSLVLVYAGTPTIFANFRTFIRLYFIIIHHYVASLCCIISLCHTISPLAYFTPEHDIKPSMDITWSSHIATSTPMSQSSSGTLEPRSAWLDIRILIKHWTLTF
jgi:hypothetical protein